MKERYWDTWHDIKEALADGQPAVPVKLHFVHPTEVGFDPEKLKDFKGTIVCTPAPAIMIHFLRPTATGSELRTRFYMGYITVLMANRFQCRKAQARRCRMRSKK